MLGELEAGRRHRSHRHTRWPLMPRRSWCSSSAWRPSPRQAHCPGARPAQPLPFPPSLDQNTRHQRRSTPAEEGEDWLRRCSDLPSASLPAAPPPALLRIPQGPVLGSQPPREVPWASAQQAQRLPELWGHCLPGRKPPGDRCLLPEPRG